MDLRRWTPLSFVAPGRFVDRDPFWDDFDFEGWADGEYDWVEDRWNGYLDLARRPRETVDAGVGDCEDFALVAVSWAVAQGREGVGIAFCWKPPYPWPSHVIAFDAECVYSSGDVEPTGVDEWLAESDYSVALRRRVS
jgi:hypothetical protein